MKTFMKINGEFPSDDIRHGGTGRTLGFGTRRRSTAGGGFGDVNSWTLVVSASGYDQDSRAINVTGPNTRLIVDDFLLNVTTTGNVFGRAVDSSNQTFGISNVTVSLYDQLGPSGTGVDPTTYTTISDANGYFFFSRINAGDRPLNLSQPNYQSISTSYVVGAGNLGTDAKLYTMTLKRGTITIQVWDAADKTSRPGFSAITLKVTDITVFLDPAVNPVNTFVIALPIGTRSFLVTTPFYDDYTFQETIKEGDNGIVNIYLNLSEKKKRIL